MNSEQFDRLIKILGHIEEATSKVRVKLSWLPFWLAGWLFTVGYNFTECIDVLAETPRWGYIFYFVLWFAGWPWFLGRTLAP